MKLKQIILTNLAVVAFFSLIGCQPKSSLTSTSPLPTIVPTINISQAVYTIGDSVDFGDILMRVLAVDDTYTDVDIEYSKVKQKLLTVQVSFEVLKNPQTIPFDFDPSDLEILTASHLSIKPELNKGKKPLLTAQKLAPDSVHTGWITFIVGQNEGEKQLAYKPKFFGEDMRVVICLEKE